MASTKTASVLFDTETLVASAADQESTVLDLQDSYGGSIKGNVLNGGTGPTIGVSVQAWVSDDNSVWQKYGGAFAAGVVLGTAYYFYFDFPMHSCKYAKLTAGSNTGQDTVIYASGLVVDEVA